MGRAAVDYGQAADLKWRHVMTKEELKQIYYINREIEMGQRELSDIYGLQSPSLDGLPRSTKIGDSTGDNAIRAAQIEKIIKGLLEKLQMKRKEIYEFISGIDNSFMRQVIMYRCLSLCTWEEVALYIGGGNTADSIRMAFNRFLKE